MTILTSLLRSGVAYCFACAVMLFPHASLGHAIPRCEDELLSKPTQGPVISPPTQALHHYFGEEGKRSDLVSSLLVTTKSSQVLNDFDVTSANSIPRPNEEAASAYKSLNYWSQTRIEAGRLAAETDKWMREIKNKIPIVINANTDWQHAVAVLEGLPLKQKIRVLTSSRLTPETARLDLLSMADLQQRISMAKDLTDALKLEKVLKPSTGEELPYPQIKLRTPAELREFIMLPQIENQRVRYLYAQQNARMIGITKNMAELQMVGPGKATQPGELREVPSGEAVRIDTNRNGVRCFRSSQPSDLLLDPSTMHVRRSWDPAAFPDVGLLIKRPQGGDMSEVTLCSFVRISRTHILTAAHCVSREEDAQSWRALQLDDPEIEVIAIVPNFTVPVRDSRKCFDSPDKCGFFVTKLQGTGIFPDKEIMRWGGVTPEPDIALIPAVFPSAPPPSTALASISNDKNLTLAGYGMTNLGGNMYEYAGDLQVGWNKMPNELDGAILVWDVNPQKGHAGACNGDSGGAVFAGSVAVPNDKRELIGLVSFGKGDLKKNGIDFCMTASTGVATRLREHLPWICNKLADKAIGC